MNFPPRLALKEAHANEIFANNFLTQLDRGLEAADRSRQEATPEPSYANDEHVEQCLQLLCELQRNHFKPLEAGKLRQSIANAEYWKLEAQFYEAAVNDHLKKNAPTTADGWRAIAKAYKGLPWKVGCGKPQVENLRLSIGDQAYWGVEMEHFEALSNIREYKLREEWKKAEERRQKPPARQPLQTQQLKPPTQMQQQEDRVSNRTRSKTGGGVTKRASGSKRTKRK